MLNQIRSKHKCTKAEFEVKLAKEFGFGKVARDIIKEEAADSNPDFPTYNVLSLYYMSNGGKHIASWMKSKGGWIFESAYD